MTNNRYVKRRERRAWLAGRKAGRAAFENAIEYDNGRRHPASETVRFLWMRILDKPHFALPYIQDELDDARSYLERLKKKETIDQ